MVTARLKGGLGNQMFQIAAAYAYAKDYGDEFGIDLKITHHGGQGHPHLKYDDNLYKDIPRVSFKDKEFTMYNEPKFSYTKIEKQDSNIIIDGYFQSEKYFAKYKDEIQNLFTFPEDITEQVETKYKKIKEVFGVEDVVCVHVRRGEYLQLPNIHPAQTAAYYKTAMNKFKDDNVAYVVISDDMAWCEQNLSGDNVSFFNTGYDYFTTPRTEELLELFDLYLASICSHNIIPNSSFGWWGAWLNKNNNRVYAPSTWFGPDGPQDYDDIYCESWLTL